MRPIYKSLTLQSALLVISSLSLEGRVHNGSEEMVEQAITADLLESLKVNLVAPNVSGARDLIASGECVVSGQDLDITLETGNWIKGGTYRLQVLATFGTQTQVIYALDIIVPRYKALESEQQEYSDEIVVVQGVGDGDESGADASVYAKDGDGNAHITTPLNVSGSVQEGSPYSTQIYELEVVVLTPEQKAEVETATGTAYDYCDTSDGIPDGLNVTIYSDEECTQKVGSISKTEFADENVPVIGDFFNLQDGESIAAGTYYARREREAIGDNSHAEGTGTTASGDNSHAEGVGTTASGDTSHAEGVNTSASGYVSHAEGEQTSASGYASHAEGGYTKASGDCSHAEGNTTTASRDYSHAEGTRTTASGYASHAEGFGTVANGAYSHAEGNTTTASGGNSHAEGTGTTASGDNSHAEGAGTIASQSSQHVCGQYNVEDEDDTFQFIVGNGADDEHRSNAFGVTKSGSLALFKADGTPIYLDADKLEALIAQLPTV